METFSALLAICAGNSPVSGEFPAQRPVTRSFDIIFDVRLNKQLSKQSWGWWFETQSCSLWRHCNVDAYFTWYVIEMQLCNQIKHYYAVIMDAMASQITTVTIVYWSLFEPVMA